MTRPALLLLLALAACGPDAPGGPADRAEADVSPPVLDAAALSAWLPAEVEGRPRVAVADSTDAALGAEVARASATYGAGPGGAGPAVALAVSDLGSADMAERMGYGWGLGGRAGSAVGGHPAQVGGGVAGRPYEHRALVAGRFLVEAESPDAALAEAAVRAVDLDGLAGAGRQGLGAGLEF